MLAFHHIRIYFFALCVWTGASSVVWAQSAVVPQEQPTASGMRTSLMLSPYTYHFTPKPTHRPVILLGLEREYPNAKLDGVALFKNSFGQPSIYVYPFGGVYKDIFGVNQLQFKWTAGLVYGYRGEFKNEVANVGGFAPVAIIAMGYEFKPGWVAQVNTLGKAAAQFQLNVKLD
jgi:hypothetical protein